MNSLTALTRLGLFLVATSLFMATPALGQSPEVQTATLSSIDDSVTGNMTGGDVIAFNKFDTSLGTLNSVTLAFSNIFVTGTVTIYNFSSTSETYDNVTFTGNYTVSDSVNNVISASSFQARQPQQFRPAKICPFPR